MGVEMSHPLDGYPLTLSMTVGEVAVKESERGGSCVDACPFGAMQFEERTELAVKCDLCVDRLAEGMKTACMSVCPTGCIHFGPEKSIASVFEHPV